MSNGCEPKSLDVYYVPMDEIVALHGREVAVNQHTLKKLGLAMAIRNELVALGVKPRGDVLGQLATQAVNEGLDVEDITPETVSDILRACGIQYVHELVFTIKVDDLEVGYYSSLCIEHIYAQEFNPNGTAYLPYKIIDGTPAIHADEIEFTAESNSDMRLVLRGCYTQSGGQNHYEFTDSIVDAIKTRCDRIHVLHARGARSGWKFEKATIKTTSGTYEFGA